MFTGEWPILLNELSLPRKLPVVWISLSPSQCTMCGDLILEQHDTGHSSDPEALSQILLSTSKQFPC